ncbi:MAG: ABC transporter ATP-binding protein [Propionibacteriaceae bacterium]
MTAPLVFRNLTVGYQTGWGRRRVVLSNVSAEVQSGELVALVGPNGAGKSTLLRSLAGLQPTFGGTVELCGDDRDALARTQIARRMAVVLTDHFDAERLTVREVVALGRQPYTGLTGLTGDDDERIITESLEVCGALSLQHREVSTLSDGQRQRIMVARALAQQPSVLLLDEPTAFLDPPGRVALVSLLRKLCRERDLAVVICTHDIEGILYDADQVWVATPQDGLKAGTPEDMILDGSLTKPFATPGVAFDPNTLTFKSTRTQCPRAYVIGEGMRASAAVMAMNRAGYDTEQCLSLPTPKPAVWVSVEENTWTLHTTTHTYSPVRSLAELYWVAKELI